MMGFFRLLLLTFLRNAIIGINWVSEIVYGCVKNQSLKYRRVSPKIKNLKLMRK